MATKKVYLVAYYFMRPKNQRVKTHIAGWLKNENNISWDEQIALTTKLKEKDLTTAKVIMNLSDRVVIRNSVNNNKDFNELFDHYYKNYKKDLHPVVENLGYFQSQPNATLNENDTIFTVPTDTISTVITDNTLQKAD